MPTQWRKFADRDSIPGHNKGLALVKLAHNLAAVIAELTLGDLSGHARSVARVLHALPVTSRRAGRASLVIGVLATLSGVGPAYLGVKRCAPSRRMTSPLT